MTRDAIAGVDPVDRIEPYRQAERATGDHCLREAAGHMVRLDDPAGAGRTR